MDDDIEIEDILSEKKKRKKGGPKGKRGERELVNFLNNRFKAYLSQNPDMGGFSRSVGSGNRWGQGVALSQSAKNTYLGDITCPDGFTYVIESKYGYDNIDLTGLFGKGNKEFESFLDQAQEAAKMTDRKPILCWRKTGKSWITFFLLKDLPKPIKPIVTITYNGWIGMSLEDAFSASDKFYFSK